MALAREIEVALPHRALAEADWADAWRVDLSSAKFSSARELGEAFVQNFPAWAWPMLILRNLMVSPFGLTGTKETPGLDKIGFFPVIEESGSNVVAGIDDKHLDFRIVLDLDKHERRQRCTITTVIKRHNWFGRTYLQLVLPFHRWIIRSSLRSLAKSQVAKK